MSFWTALLAEITHQYSAWIAAGLAVSMVFVRFAGEDHRRARGSVALFAVHLVLLPVVAALRASGSDVTADVRLASVVALALASVGLGGSLVFTVVLPRLRLSTPRILQDVIIAGTSLVALIAVASRHGINLSGLIATSAVITAVIGFSLQDTLGNVIGGLAVQMDTSIRVGDWVKVGDVSGRITEIRWRYTAVETRNWETVIIPNGTLMKSQVMVLGRRTGEPQQWRRWVYFNVDFRQQPTDVIREVNAALQAPMANVAAEPAPNCILMDLHDSYGRYAVRYWLTDLLADDPTDSLIRTRVYFALKRASIPLSIPAHALFMTEESADRKQEKRQEDLARRIHALELIDLFAQLTPEDRARLAARLRYAPFSPGEVMTRQGAKAHWLYMVIEGEASVRVAGDHGLETEIGRLQVGGFFGEMSLLTGEPREATVVALTDVECYRLDKAAFQGLVQEKPELAKAVADVLARRKVEVAAAREHLDQEAQARRLAAAKTDLLGKIRVFFGLEGEGGPGSGTNRAAG